MTSIQNRTRMDRGHANREILFGTVKTSTSSLQSATMTASLLMLAILASVAVLYLTSSLLVPIVIACLAYLTLRPVVCRLCKRGLSQTVASSVVILVLFGMLGLVVGLLYQPAQHWIESAPESVATMQKNLDSWREPLTVLDSAEAGLADASAEASGERPTVEVSVQKPSMISETVLVNSTGQVLAFFVAIAVLTFFLLSTGDDLINRFLYVLPDDKKRHETLKLISGIQDSVGRYFT